MCQLIIGTTNEAKVKQIRGALLPLGIEIKGVEDKSLLPDVKEDGATAQENAKKKAIAYAKVLDNTVLSMDNALFLDGLPDEKQPEINVRRLPGRADRPTDEEMISHYASLVGALGNNINGRWEFAICVASPDGQIAETTIISPRRFTSTPSASRVPGYPLESIQIDPASGRYISEMSQDEQDVFWQKAIGQPLCNFIKSLKL